MIEADKEKLVSVIIPAYNVESYLARCLDTVLAQTYRLLDVILVDDGSTDNSKTICEAYAAKDTRIRVIRQKNSGLSAARNTGIDHARGEWLAFVDADDMLEPTFVEELLCCAVEAETKMSMCSYRLWYGTDKANKDLPLLSGVLGSAEALQRFFLTRGRNFGFSWNKLYHRSLFENVRFPVGMAYEDMYVLADLTKTAGACAVINKALYNYVQRADSITHARHTKFLADAMKASLHQLHRVAELHPALTGLAADVVLNMSCFVMSKVYPVRKQAEYAPLWQQAVTCYGDNRSIAAKDSLIIKATVICYRVSPVLLGRMCCLWGRLVELKRRNAR